VEIQAVHTVEQMFGPLFIEGQRWDLHICGQEVVEEQFNGADTLMVHLGIILEELLSAVLKGLFGMVVLQLTLCSKSNRHLM
jgi:hypothetical protein